MQVMVVDGPRGAVHVEASRRAGRTTRFEVTDGLGAFAQLWAVAP